MSETVYEIAKEKILERMERAENSGTIFRWIRPWSGGAPYPCAYKTSKPYRGINAITLIPGEYITYKQMLEAKEKNPNVHIKKGCVKERVFFFSFKERTEVVDGKEETISIPVFKYYSVFNIDDVKELKSKFPYEEQEHTLTEDMEKANNFIKEYCERCGVSLDISPGASQAFYTPHNHAVTLPDKNQFKSIYDYYNVCFHELVHSTQGKLGREQAASQSGSSYAKEELVAEIGASMLCNRFRIVDDGTEENSIAYLREWCNYIREEKATLIVSAASQAQKACDLICDELYKEINHEVKVEPKEISKEKKKKPIRSR